MHCPTLGNTSSSQRDQGHRHIIASRCHTRRNRRMLIVWADVSREGFLEQVLLQLNLEGLGRQKRDERGHVKLGNHHKQRYRVNK